MKILIVLEVGKPLQILQEIRQIEEHPFSAVEVKKLKLNLPKATQEEYIKVWYDRIPKKQKILCQNNNHQYCHHKNLQLRKCTFCKECKNKHLKKPCMIRQCYEKSKKHRVIYFKRQDEEIIKLVVEGVLHTHEDEDILEVI